MMKRGFFAFFALGLFFTARGADTGVEFSGVLTTDGKTKIALTNKANGITRWVDPGGEFNGFQVARYDGKDEVVILHRAGQDFRLPLVAPQEPVASPAPSPVAVRGTPAASRSRGQTSSPPAAVAAPPPPPVAVLAPEPPTPTGRAPTPATANVPANNNTRPVQAGETLESIASAAGLTPQQLQALNPNLNRGSLQVGQLVRIR